MNEKNQDLDIELFKKDLHKLNCLCNAYNNCNNKEMKIIWKNKWYQMNQIIASKKK